MPTNINDILSAIIIHDEGGFVLTHNANDPDGGWTYGGMIRGNWTKPYCDWSVDQMQNGIMPNEPFFKQTCLDLYNDKFVVPSRVTELPGFIQQCYLSAVINCGQSATVKMLQLVFNKSQDAADHLVVDGVIGDKTIDGWQNLDFIYAKEDKLSFCDAWEDHYFDIVVANTADWITYLDATVTGKNVKEPTVNFSADLHGWINRVRRNRDA